MLFVSASDGSSGVLYQGKSCGAFACVLKQIQTPGSTEEESSSLFDYGECVFIEHATNSDTEALGLLFALKNLQAIQKETGEKVLCHHYTDSEYVFKSMTLWFKAWIRQGWKNSTGSLVPQRKIFSQCLEIMKEVDLVLHHVPSNHKIKTGVKKRELKCFEHYDEACSCTLSLYNQACEQKKYDLNEACDFLCNALRFRITGQKSGTVTEEELKIGLTYLEKVAPCS